MDEDAKKNVGGRPKLKLEPAQFYRARMCRMSFEDMAAVVGCSRDTVERRRQEDPECDLAYQQGRIDRRVRFQAKLDEMALEGCWPALKMIATNELGYSLKQQVEHTGEMTAKYVAEIPAPLPMEAWQVAYGRDDDPNATVQ